MAAAQKTLFEACVETFGDWVSQYDSEFNTDVEYAIIADGDPSNKKFLIAICDRDSFPLHAEDLEQITVYDGTLCERDKSMVYPVVGIINEAELTLFCGQMHFTTFFTGTGKLLNNVVVKDLVKEEKMKKVHNANAHRGKQKKDAKKQRRESQAVITASNHMNTVESDEAGGHAERKREKRRAKQQRQKGRRKTTTGVQVNEHENKMEQLRAQLESMGELSGGGLIVDPTTEEGREMLEMAAKEGWKIEAYKFEPC